MFEREATLYDFQLVYFREMVGQVDADKLAHVPGPGIKPPAWILGHLAIANDYALKVLGKPGVCPSSWFDAFGPGSDPIAAAADAPSKDELVAKYEEGHRAVRDALGSATSEAMDAPHDLPMELLRRTLPTAGDLLAHLMTTHSAHHLGQLATWRRAMDAPKFF